MLPSLRFLKPLSGLIVGLALLGLLTGEVNAYSSSDLPVYTSEIRDEAPIAGEFVHVCGISHKANGNIIATDRMLGMVHELTSDGLPVNVSGSKGLGNYRNIYSYDYTEDLLGNYYTLDLTGVSKYSPSGEFIRYWGNYYAESYGSADGKFGNGLRSLEFNPNDGLIYVADRGNNRIEVFDTDGNFIRKFGSSGSGDGLLNSPWGITIGSDGNIYVNDSGNNRVQVFTPAGVFVRKWGSVGTGAGQFTGLRFIAADSLGNVYTTEESNHRVQKFTIAGEFIAQWGGIGSTDGKFNIPWGIDVNPNGDIYVADYNNFRIQRFTPAGVFVQAFGSAWSRRLNYMRTLRGLEVDENGNYYVVMEQPIHKINKYSSNGQLLLSFGVYGNAGGQLNSPYSVRIDQDGYIYVANYGNHAIMIFDSNGNFVSNIGTPGVCGSGNGVLCSPRDLLITSEGYVFVPDPGNDRVQRFIKTSAPGDPPVYAFDMKWGVSGSGDGQLNDAMNIVQGPDGRIYITDVSNNRIVMYTKDGVFLGKFGGYGVGDGQMKFPQNITIYENTIFVSDQDNNRIQLFTLDGVFLNKWINYNEDSGFYWPSGLAVRNDTLAVVQVYGDNIALFNFDKLPPVNSIDPIGGSFGTQSPLITGNAIDALTKITSVEFQVDGTSGSWSACSSTDGIFDELNEAFSCQLSGISEGAHTLYVRSVDNRTNPSTDLTSATFVVDLTPPTGTIEINSGALKTGSTLVTVNLNAIDNLSTVTEMLISTDPLFSGAVWESYSNSSSITLPSGGGNKTVYVKFKDEVGNISSTYSDSIELDVTTTNPVLTQVGLINNIPDRDRITYYFLGNYARISGMAEPNSTVRFTFDGKTFNATANSSGNWTINITGLMDGENVLTYFAIDEFGNISGSKILVLILGLENFPQWLQDKIIGLTGLGGTELLSPTPTPTSELPITGEDEIPQDEQVGDLAVFRVLGENGELLVGAEITIDGQTYITNSKGEITVMGIENKLYSISIYYRGQRYNVNQQISSDFSIVQIQTSSVDVNLFMDFIKSDVAERIGILAIILPLTNIVSTTMINLYYSMRYGLIYFSKRKKNQWGLVFDSFSHKPIAYAVVRVFDEFEKQVAISVSDRNGKYQQDLNNGIYLFEIMHSDYNPYSEKLTVNNISGLNKDFALFEKGLETSKKLHIDFRKILDYLTIIFFIYTLICLFFSAMPWNIAISIVYIVIFVIKFFKRNSENSGLILNENGKGVGGVFVQIMNKNGLLLETSLSNDQGRLRFNVPDGEYSAKVFKEGFSIKDQEVSPDKLTGNLKCSIKKGRMTDDLIIKI